MSASVIVSGAAGGIGAAIAWRFARGGYAPALFDIDQPAAAKMAGAMIEEGHRAAAFGIDVGDAAAVEDAVSKVSDELGPVSVVINNAAVRHLAPALSTTPEAFEAVLRTNLSGAFFLSASVARRMREGGRGGAIISIASVAGSLALPDRVAYVASKHGLIGLTRALAIELGVDNIRVNAIAPGGVETALAREAFGDEPSKRLAAEAAIPLGRLASTDEIADVAWFLASSAARYLNGTVITVDGGFSAGKSL